MKGVITNKQKIVAKKTILTTGTFLNGVMYTGKESSKGGRVGDLSSIPLSEKLYSMNLPMGRLKTGTPARVKLSSLNLSVMEEQPGEEPTPFMSLKRRDRRTSKTTLLLHNKNKPEHPRNYKEQHSFICDVFRKYCRHRTKILPINRGQGP